MEKRNGIKDNVIIGVLTLMLIANIVNIGVSSNTNTKLNGHISSEKELDAMRQKVNDETHKRIKAEINLIKYKANGH